MTPADFRAWRNAMGFTQAQAAEALGLGKSAIEQYDTGKRRSTGETIEEVPRHLALACAALARDLKPWGEQ